MRKNRFRAPAALVAALLTVSMLLTACNDGRTGSTGQLSVEQATESLNALLTKIDTTELPPELDLNSDSYGGLAAELPDIDTYPLTARGNAQIDVEIFASTEKSTVASSGKNIDGWLVDVAEDFNRQGLQVNGKSVSVSVRAIASGTATDYIISRKYIPDAFSPSNELWAMMIESRGVSLDQVDAGVAGNTAGILMTERRYKDFTDAHGEVTLEKVVDAALNGELLLGYTNPYVSSTGLNILTAMLQSFDPANPLSDTAMNKLEQLQAKIPPVSYTTAQMRETASKGLLDAMVMEYQAYINTPELKNYKFVPFGVRHDNPVYAVEGCSAEKREALKLFTDYCQDTDAQKKALDIGFNANPTYKAAELNYTGEQLFAAQEVWKKKKDAGQPVVAVFVTDVSGSMEGTPIAELRSSLLNASQYIGDTSYVGLVSYSHEVFINLPIDQFNNNQRAAFNGAVKSLSANGGTATYDAVLVAAKMLLDAKKEIPNAKLMMFVLSDGEQRDGYAFSKVSSVLEGLRIPIHTICYGTDIAEMEKMSLLNEASSIKASPEDVVYNLKNIFNAQM